MLATVNSHCACNGKNESTRSPTARTDRRPRPMATVGAIPARGGRHLYQHVKPVATAAVDRPSNTRPRSRLL
jgi:hypothetical protein